MEGGVHLGGIDAVVGRGGGGRGGGQGGGGGRVRRVGKMARGRRL